MTKTLHKIKLKDKITNDLFLSLKNKTGLNILWFGATNQLWVLCTQIQYENIKNIINTF